MEFLRDKVMGKKIWRDGWNKHVDLAEAYSKLYSKKWACFINATKPTKSWMVCLTVKWDV